MEFQSEHPEATIAVVLHLSWLRSAAKVGMALAVTYPGEDEWQAFLNAPELMETIDELAPVIADIRAAAELGTDLSPEQVQLAVEQHYGRALDAVEVLAERLGIAPADLLAVLVQR